MLIAIDYGHSKKADDGAYGILEEFKVNREYGSLVKKYLEQLGHTVDVVSKDTCISESDALKYRVQMEHKKKYDLYISCHANCFNGIAEGCEVLYYSNSGKVYAEKVVNEIAKLGFKNRGAKFRDNLYVVKNTNAVAILIEPFFVDNKNDVQKYNADKLARSIVKGITGQDVITQNDSKIANVTQSGSKELAKYYTLEFQKFYNETTKTKKPISEDSTWGEETKKAYETLGKLMRGEY